MKIEIRSLSFDKVKDKYDYLLKEIDKLPENDKEIILDFRFLRWAEPIAMSYYGWAYLNILFHMLLKVKNTGHVQGNNTYIPITNINVKEEYGKSFLRGEYF